MPVEDDDVMRVRLAHVTTLQRTLFYCIGRLGSTAGRAISGLGGPRRPFRRGGTPGTRDARPARPV